MKIPNVNGDVRTVGQLTTEIRTLLEEGIGDVLVVGEISNFKTHTSGHRYFTLKDGDAQIACTMWRSRTLNFAPTDGMRVLLGGSLTVYAARGNYQIDCAWMRPEGVGDLYAAYEKLKKGLALKGWFDPDAKKALPDFPQSVGIATSATGAAAHDMFSTIQRRFPALDVVFRPTQVQGADATTDIVRAIKELDAADLDVLIIGRGGGSIEDLWCFNTEEVATAIHNARTPLVSAVGHETDYTIADFVADQRAATPTAAAELVTPYTSRDLMFTIDELALRIARAASNNISDLRIMAESFLDGTAARRVMERIMHRSQRIDDLQTRMTARIGHSVQLKQQVLSHLSTQLQTLHPHRPLRLGYAIVERDGKAMKATDILKMNDVVRLVRNSDTSIARIESTQQTNHGS